MTPAVLYSDAHLIAIQKPAGLAVHAAPGPGSSVLRLLRETLGLKDLTPVHRLDKDVSGALLLARRASVAAALQKTWDRTEKTYLAFCEGAPQADEGEVNAPILEHRSGDPARMERAVRWWCGQHPGENPPPLPAPKTSAVHAAGRPSQTRFRVVERFQGGAWSLLELEPRQGRMHQLRVHLKELGTPLAADRLYGRREVLRACDVFGGSDETPLLEGAPLHASRLVFTHPEYGKRIEVVAPLPENFERLLERLRGQ